MILAYELPNVQSGNEHRSVALGWEVRLVVRFVERFVEKNWFIWTS